MTQPGVYAVVIEAYQAEKQAQLTLQVGDRVKVTKQGAKNWVGTLNGKVGSFPSSHVELEPAGGFQSSPGIARGNSSSQIASCTSSKPVPTVVRAKSNFTRDGGLPPPPSGLKAPRSPVHLPPPPSSIIGNAPLPKPIAPISIPDDGGPAAPPRSPKRPMTTEDLPSVPARDGEEADPADVSAEKEKGKADMRKKCILEIYQTEKDYIEDLETMINVFIFPMKTMAVVSEQVLYNIFSNLEVFIFCNVEMLKELEQVMAATEEVGGDVNVGEIFTKLSDYFKMYKVYCANQQTSLATVDQQIKKSPQFKKKLDICHSDPRCRGLFLQSFLIKPIQRVCKYPLLLRELIRYTPETHADYQPLQNAFNKINEVVSNINEGQRQAEGLQRIIDLQTQIDGIDTLVAPNRNLQKEGDLNYYKNAKTKHPEKRHVFFFSDLIMLTIKKGEKRFEHKLSIPLEGCTLTVLADSTNIKSSFELEQGEKKHKVKCILGCDTSQESHAWVKNIKGLIKEYQKRKFSELKKLQEQGLTPITPVE